MELCNVVMMRDPTDLQVATFQGETIHSVHHRKILAKKKTTKKPSLDDIIPQSCPLFPLCDLSTNESKVKWVGNDEPTRRICPPPSHLTRKKRKKTKKLENEWTKRITNRTKDEKTTGIDWVFLRILCCCNPDRTMRTKRWNSAHTHTGVCGKVYKRTEKQIIP